ncbi:hypothetical protein [Erythrobacter sp. Alg231-14]|uniref:hypothetical protein n=1 Tax=Erythrobacter sp. Alg231-14 TaxID=1922225 RepID=UPI000D55CC33
MIVDLLAWDFRVILQDVLAWTICICALIWGAGPERAVAITWLLLFEVLHELFALLDDRGRFLANVDAFYASVDGLAAVCWIAIALYANRNYTLWIAAMQVLAVSAHLAKGIAEPISQLGYAVMVIAPSWIQLLLLAVGLIRHILRRRRFGAYRDWRVTGTPDKLSLFSNPKITAANFAGDAKKSWRDDLT